MNAPWRKQYTEEQLKYIDEQLAHQEDRLREAGKRYAEYRRANEDSSADTNEKHQQEGSS